jgi:hypothetical protein
MARAGTGDVGREMQLRPRPQLKHTTHSEYVRQALLRCLEAMPIFEVQSGGRTFEVEAPDLQTAVKALAGLGWSSLA